MANRPVYAVGMGENLCQVHGVEFSRFSDNSLGERLSAFNPEKSSSCQAEACAYYVALRRCGLLEDAMESKDKFVQIVYHVTSSGTAVKVEPPKPTIVINVGDAVRHPKYGDGVVTAVSEDKNPEILTIQFAVGEKKIAKDWLAAAIAKMK